MTGGFFVYTARSAFTSKQVLGIAAHDLAEAGKGIHFGASAAEQIHFLLAQGNDGFFLQRQTGTCAFLFHHYLFLGVKKELVPYRQAYQSGQLQVMQG